MSRPRVWFVHEPLRFDRKTRTMIPLRNLNTAAEYGDIVFAMRTKNRPREDLDSILPDLQKAMEYFVPHDYLALAGDLHLLALASILAARAIGPEQPLQMLRWLGRAAGGGRYVLYSAKP